MHKGIAAHFLIGLSLLAVLAWGCGGGHGPEGLQPGSDPVVEVQHFCGQPSLTSVSTQQGSVLCVLEVANDSAGLFLTLRPDHQVAVTELWVYAGPFESLPRLSSGAADSSKFEKHLPKDPSSPWTLRLAKASVGGDCYFLSMFLRASRQGEAVTGWIDEEEKRVNGTTLCLNACHQGTLQCSLADSAARPITFQVTDWTGPGRNGDRDLMEAEFPAIYPAGLKVGCDDTVVIRDWDEFLVALGSKKPAQKLNESGENTLVSEILSLDAALRLEKRREKSHTPILGMLQIAHGAFEGWRVIEVMEEAHRVVGGCTSSYTPSQIEQVLHLVNASLAGRHDTGFLRCPETNG